MILVKLDTVDIENMKYNTAIASLMALLNEIYEKGAITKGELKTFLTILSPFAPHLCEELWQQHGFEGMLANGKWAEYDESKTVDDTVEMPVQVNGKVRSTVMIPNNASKEEALKIAMADDKIKAAIDGKSIFKEIVVPGKIINIVIK